MPDVHASISPTHVACFISTLLYRWGVRIFNAGTRTESQAPARQSRGVRTGREVVKSAYAMSQHEQLRVLRDLMRGKSKPRDAAYRLLRSASLSQLSMAAAGSGLPKR